MPLELRQITLHREPDDVQDISYLGEFVRGPGEGTINLWEHGRHPPEADLYFWSQHYPYNPKNWAHVSDEDKQKVIAEYGSLENACLQYALQDYDRLQAYNRGDWSMQQVQVRAEVNVTDRAGTILGKFTLLSYGCGGIESDSGDEYFEECYREEIDQIRPALHELGFTDAEIDAAVQP